MAVKKKKAAARRRPAVKELSKKRKKLLIEIEGIIGRHCYNGNIQNYYDWEWEGEGRWFRYPLTTTYKSVKRKHRWPDDDMTTQELLSGRYAFGANQLHIMAALSEVIDLIESRQKKARAAKKKKAKAS